MADETPPARITVTLHPKSRSALDTLTAEHTLSSTETVNRALQLYAYVSAEQAAGGKVRIHRPDGDVETVAFL